MLLKKQKLQTIQSEIWFVEMIFQYQSDPT